MDETGCAISHAGHGYGRRELLAVGPSGLRMSRGHFVFIRPVGHFGRTMSAVIGVNDSCKRLSRLNSDSGRVL